MSVHGKNPPKNPNPSIYLYACTVYMSVWSTEVLLSRAVVQNKHVSCFLNPDKREAFMCNVERLIPTSRQQLWLQRRKGFPVKVIDSFIQPLIQYVTERPALSWRRHCKSH